MPTPLVVDCLDVLSPVLTRMLNLSLETGSFLDNWKQANVHPRLKKPRAEVTFNNLCLISNLSFVSKLVERAIFSQTHELCMSSILKPSHCTVNFTALKRRYCGLWHLAQYEPEVNHSPSTTWPQCSLWYHRLRNSTWLSTHPLWYLGACTPLVQVPLAEYWRGLRQSMVFHKDLVLVPSFLSSMQASCSRQWNITCLRSMHMVMTHSCTSPSTPTLVRSNQQLRRTCKNVLLNQRLDAILQA